MRSYFLALSFFFRIICSADTLVRPTFSVPIDPRPYLAAEPGTPGPYLTQTLISDLHAGVVTINQEIVLQKDAYIFADTVLLYGNIITLGHNLTIICRRIYFPTRRFEGIYHIQSVASTPQKRVQDTQRNIIPGKVNIIASEIYGLPYISNSRSLATDYISPADDAPSEININYGVAEPEDSQNVFAHVTLGIGPQHSRPANVISSLKPLREHLINIQQSASTLTRLVGAHQALSQNSALGLDRERVKQSQEQLGELIADTQRAIRQQIFTHDAEIQEMANKVDPNNSKAILDLFNPDEISIKKIEFLLKNSQDPIKIPALLDSQKWIVDLTHDTFSIYYKNCDLRKW